MSEGLAGRVLPVGITRVDREALSTGDEDSDGDSGSDTGGSPRRISQLGINASSIGDENGEENGGIQKREGKGRRRSTQRSDRLAGRIFRVGMAGME